MPLREYVFKTSHESNLLCRWTKGQPDRWILVQLLRGTTRGRAQSAVFTIRAPQAESERFLREEFGKRYGTFVPLFQSADLVSVEVTNYLMPSYHGADPIELATSFLGPTSFFYPVLVHDGYLHIRVVATPPPEGRQFAELLDRLTSVTNPADFRLVHTGAWDPLPALQPKEERLTPRQKEVLRVAIEFGYYDEPRRCTLSEIAQAFGVSKAAVHKQLAVVESKIMKGQRVAIG